MYASTPAAAFRRAGVGVTVAGHAAGPQRATRGGLGAGRHRLRGGRGDDGEGGVALLYLHGLCDMHAVWAGDAGTDVSTAWRRASTSWRPLCPGTTAAPGSRTSTTSRTTCGTSSICARPPGSDDVDVVGHSLGGWFGAELALRRPELVRRLVLLGPLGVHVPGVEVPPFFGAVAPRGIGGAGEARRLLFADPGGPWRRRRCPTS